MNGLDFQGPVGSNFQVEFYDALKCEMVNYHFNNLYSMQYKYKITS